MYYAHRTESEDTSEWQSLKEHLRNVQELSGQYGDAFGAREWAELTGALHDLGKYSIAFQKRLAGDPKPVDHATTGAQYL